MRVYNYASFAKVFSKGIIKPNMTKIAKILFEPVISLGDCVNRHGEPYTIDNKSASLWYKQEADIPGNLKKAVNDGRVYKGIGKYFTDEELRQQEIEIRSAIPPEEMLLWAKYMFPAFSTGSRIEMLKSISAAAPKQFYEAVLKAAESVLPAAAFKKLKKEI